MSAPKPKIEHQIRCNDDTHRTHRYATSNPKKAQERVEQMNGGHIYADPNTEPVPGHRTCAPWRLEARLVTPWEHPADVDELAAMLVRDWFDFDDERLTDELQLDIALTEQSHETAACGPRSPDRSTVNLCTSFALIRWWSWRGKHYLVRERRP